MNQVFRFRLQKLFLVPLLLFSTVGCDQATKLIARDTLTVSGPISYLGNMVRLQYAENPGAFLSLGAHLSETMRFWIFTVLVGSFLMVVAFQLIFRKQDLFHTVGYSLVLAGGIGNLIDRVIRGSVIDFLNLGVGPIRTGIFNVADIAIVSGVCLLIAISFRAPARVATPAE